MKVGIQFVFPAKAGLQSVFPAKAGIHSIAVARFGLGSNSPKSHGTSREHHSYLCEPPRQTALRDPTAPSADPQTPGNYSR